MEATVYIDGEIVTEIPLGEDGFPVPGSFTTLAMVRDQLEWRKPYDSVKAIINSPGGSVTGGFGICDLLASQTVPVTTEAIGQCSSISTAIFLSGKTRRIHPHTIFHVHLPNGGVIGTADDVQAYADEMKRCEQQLIDCYVARAGVTEEVIRPLMAAETTLPVEQVLSLGFATAIVQPVTALAKLTVPVTKPAAPEAAPTFMTRFQQLVAKFTGEVKALGPNAGAEVRALAVTTKAGAALNIDTGDRETYAEGDAVTNADGTAVADGDVELADGTVLTVAAGKITKVAAATTDKKGDQDALTALAEGFGALTETVKALAGEVRDMKTASAGAATTAQVQEIKAKYDALAGSISSGGIVIPDADDANKTGGDPAAAAAEARKAKRKPQPDRVIM